MKKIYNFLFLTISISIYSQEGVIVPLNTSCLDFQSGTYAKDINNELLPFEGTWFFVNNNIKYTLVLQRLEQVLITRSQSFYFYADQMVAKYEVRELSTNTVLYTTMNATAYDDFEITSIGGVSNGDLQFNFFDRLRCNNNTRILLYKMTFQPGTSIPHQLRFYNLGGSGYWEHEGCPYTSSATIPKPLPLGSFTLTKQ